jgi:hypothetical protein
MGWFKNSRTIIKKYNNVFMEKVRQGPFNTLKGKCWNFDCTTKTIVELICFKPIIRYIENEKEELYIILIINDDNILKIQQQKSSFCRRWIYLPQYKYVIL